MKKLLIFLILVFSCLILANLAIGQNKMISNCRRVITGKWIADEDSNSILEINAKKLYFKYIGYKDIDSFYYSIKTKPCIDEGWKTSSSDLFLQTVDIITRDKD